MAKTKIAKGLPVPDYRPGLARAVEGAQWGATHALARVHEYATYTAAVVVTARLLGVKI